MKCTYPDWLEAAWLQWKQQVARLSIETSPARRAPAKPIDGMRVGRRSTTFAEAK